MGSAIDRRSRLDHPIARSPGIRDWPHRLVVTLVLVIGAGGAPVRAELGLPSLPGSGLPSFDLPLGADQRLQRSGPVLGRHLTDLRKRAIRDLLRRHGDRVEADPAGEPVVRDEVIAVSPGAVFLAAAQRAGFVVLRERSLAGLDLRFTVLRPPVGVPTRRALQSLSTLDPSGTFDFNHIYTEGGEAMDAQTGAVVDATAGAPTPGDGLSVATAPGGGVSGRIGLVDSGVDTNAPILRKAQIRPWGCDGRPIPSPHGTAVASLLVGQGNGFRASAPGLALYAADVYCGSPTGGSVDRLADAFAWLANERASVVNVSLVGPPNRLLERLVDSMLARGQVVVAAVGNDGPAAPPLYPAAYPGVVGVTGVDARRRVLPEAGRGPQVAFAAPGADLVAASGNGYTIVRGTSFAAPLVAGLLAAFLSEPAPTAGRQAIAALIGQATDLGAPGRDTVFGNGLVGEQLRVDPAQLKGLRRSR